MTKWEVKEYLTKIYNVPVKKVGRVPVEPTTTAAAASQCSRNQLGTDPFATASLGYSAAGIRELEKQSIRCLEVVNCFLEVAAPAVVSGACASKPVHNADSYYGVRTPGDEPSSPPTIDLPPPTVLVRYRSVFPLIYRSGPCRFPRQVMTQNFEGKRKRIMGKRSIVPYKRPNFKKAIVTFASPQGTPSKGSPSVPS